MRVAADVASMPGMIGLANRVCRAMVPTLCVIVLGVLAAMAPAQVVLQVAGTGSDYTGNSIAFDTANQRFLLVDSYPLQIKQWTGSSWQSIATCPYFLTTLGLDAAYDEARQVLVIVGSQVNGSIYPSIIEWDGVNWTHTPQQLLSGPSFYGSVVWDPSRQAVVMAHLHTRMWDGVNLTQIAGLPSGPYGMCFNPLSGRLLLPGNPSHELLPNGTWQAMPPHPGGHTMGTTFYDPATNTVQALPPQGWAVAPEVWDGVSWQSVQIGSSGTGWPYLKVALNPTTDEILGATPSNTYRIVRGMPTSVTAFGNGCPGAFGVPVLSTVAPSSAYTPGPVIGKRVWFELTGVLPYPYGISYILMGLENTQWNGVPLPLELSAVGMSGCYLNQSLDFFDVASFQSSTIQVPTNTDLLEMHIYVQGMGLELFGPNGPGTCFSRSLDAVVGLTW
jgi:hypothetical protein